MTYTTLTWDRCRLPEGVEWLARECGLLRGPADVKALRHIEQADELRSVDHWLDDVADRLGLEVEPVESVYGDLEAMLAAAAPAILQVGSEGEEQYILLLAARRKHLRLLCPDGRPQVVTAESIRQLVCDSLEAEKSAEVDALLAEADIRGRALLPARRLILNRQLGQKQVGKCWILRLPPHAPFRSQLRQDGAIRQLTAVLSLHAVQQGLFVAAWWLIGRAILQGRLDAGYFCAWILLLASILPIRLLESAWQARLLYRAGALLKRRLLAGVLRFEPERLRREGSGRLLAQVLESAAIENVTLTGGLLTVLACVELAAAGAVLISAPRPLWFLSTLAIWIGLTTLGTWRYIRDRRRWMIHRLDMTEDLVEKLVGYRTRIAQERPDRWHVGEDEALDAYLQASASMDRSAVGMSLLVRGWLIAGLVVLGSVLTSSEATVEAMAVGLAGVLMGAQALTRFNAGLGNLTTAVVAIGRIIPLFQAGRTVEPLGSIGVDGDTRSSEGQRGGRLLEAHQLSFRYEGRVRPVLQSCDLEIAAGERLLIEGASGTGKSTLAKLLAGILPAQSGLTLLRGLDCRTVGMARWRSRIRYVPQYHENHIFTGSLAFNLLMGRAWPPTADDLREAERVCRDLGLDHLVRRMPCGLMQTVGETGWQLSHGEKSRVYLARCLLGEPDVLVADETLAALDPGSLRQCLAALLVRKHAVVLIAHP